jgi:hypothetical protein
VVSSVMASGRRSANSRDLKTALYTRNEEGDGSVVELRARAISTAFTPVE